MTRKFLHHALLAGVTAAAIAIPAQAQEVQAPAQQREVQFDVPAQSLDGALKEFARQADIDIIYAPELVRDRTSSGVKGRLPVTGALARVLSDTGLSFREVSANVFALQDTSRPRDGAGPDAAATPLSGRVMNAGGTAGVPGARLTISGTNLETITDQEGRFYFPAVPGTATEVRIEYLGEDTQLHPIPVGTEQRRNFQITLGSPSDRILVRGYRGSLQRALNQQLYAPNNTTVVSADLLGSFPAENVAEALRRVPGVAFGRAEDSGEGTRITVRGFSSEAINIQLNGLELQGTGFERTIDLSGFLADNISQITIHKSLLPNQESNGSGGLVEIETKSGLDYGDFQFTVGVEGETGFDRDFGEEYEINGILAKRLTENFGVAATVQYRKTDRLNYNADILSTLPPVMPAGFTSVTLVPASMQFPFDEELNKRLIQSVSFLRRTRDVEDLTASFNAAWDIDDSTTLRFDLQRIRQDSYTVAARTTASYLTTAVNNMPIPELDGELRRRTVLNSLRPNIALGSVDLTYYQDTASFRGTTTLDRWKFNYKAGYARARSKSNNYNLSALGNSNTALEDIIDPATAVINPDGGGTPRFVDGGFVLAPNGLPVPSLTQFGFELLNAPGEYNLTSATRTSTNSPTESYVLEGSVRYLSPGTFLNYIEVGGKYDRSERKSQDDLFASTSIGSLSSIESYIRIFGNDTPIDYFGDGVLDNGTLEDVGAGGVMLPFLLESSIDQIFGILPTLIEDDPDTAFNERRFTYTDNRGLDPITDPSAQTPAETVEEHLSGYVETHVELGDFDLAGGVRMERFTRSGTTLTAPSVRTADGVSQPREIFIAAGLVNFETTEGTHTTWTPSVLLNYRPLDNLVARFNYYRTTVNPDFRLIRRAKQVFVDLRPTQNRVIIREANPDLKPTKTNNFEFDIAYYFKDTPGIIRAGVFYKDVKNNFTNVLFQDASDETAREDVIAYFGDLAVSNPEFVAFDENTEFLRNRPENGEGGTIWGVEAEVVRQLDFLPGFLSDFGVLGNVTYTHGDFPTLLSGRNDDGTLGQFSVNRALRDQAKWVYNASLNYARGGFEGRIIYTHQSASAEAFEVHGLDTVSPSYSTLDLRLSYNMPTDFADLTFYVQGDDLLRGSTEGDLRLATSSQFNDEAAEFYFPDNYQFNGGRTITAGIRARF